MAAIGPIAGKLKPLLLLLSSDRDGEALAAARALGRTLKAAGCDFHDLAATLTSAASAKTKFHDEEEPPRQRERKADGDWRAMRDFCLDRPTRLRREREFLESLRKWRGNITEKQCAWLEAIYTRLQRMAA